MTLHKLTLHKIESKLFQPLEWVPVVDLPSGTGLVFMTALAVQSANQNFLEACYHLHTPHEQPFPGTVLSTGTEDDFDSAYYFDGGTFRYPVAGNTHQEVGNGTVKWSVSRSILPPARCPALRVRLTSRVLAGVPLPRGGPDRLLGRRALHVAHRRRRQRQDLPRLPQMLHRSEGAG